MKKNHSSNLCPKQYFSEKSFYPEQWKKSAGLQKQAEQETTLWSSRWSFWQLTETSDASNRYKCLNCGMWDAIYPWRQSKMINEPDSV